MSSTSDLLTCRCGTKIRVPEAAAGRVLRCPRCKAEMVAAGTDWIITAGATERAAGVQCPVCQTAIGPEEVTIDCPDCRQVHHRDCWVEVGGCGTYGCKRAPTVARSAPEPEVRAAWGDNKACPACGETIKSIALRCRYCGTDFDTIDPLTVADIRARDEKEQRLGRLRREAVILFVLSVVGLLAPLMLVVGLVYVPRHRRELAQAGPVASILAYSALALSAIYSLLMLAFFLAEQGGAS